MTEWVQGSGFHLHWVLYCKIEIHQHFKRKENHVTCVESEVASLKFEYQPPANVCCCGVEHSSISGRGCLESENRDQFRKWEVSPVPHKAGRFFCFEIFVNVTEHKPQSLTQLSGSSLAPGQLSTEGPTREGRKWLRAALSPTTGQGCNLFVKGQVKIASVLQEGLRMFRSGPSDYITEGEWSREGQGTLICHLLVS